MEACKFLIVGGGLAADAAVRGIHDAGGTGPIVVVSDEDDPPYNRPPLSKALWKGTEFDSIWRHTESAGAELRLGTRIVALDPARGTATDSRGSVLAYEKLLLATGGSPRRLRNGDPSVIYFRRLADFKRTWEAASHGSEFVVVGGGFIGSEIAAALAMNGRKVSLIFPGSSICERILPRPLANFLNVYFRKRGVDVLFNERVQRIEKKAEKLVVGTRGNGRIEADVVVAGIGIEPNVDLAKAAGLDVRSGIIVDEMLRTSHPHIFAAGDVANFPCRVLRERFRFEHEDNADAMGRAAGRNMAGASEVYKHLPFFYSDLFDLRYEAVGSIDSRLEVVEDWVQKFHKGVVYYLKKQRVHGVLLWNTWGLVDAARQLIASRQELQPVELIGRLRDGG
jgi:3-phenylpropionate/trans-cinnamate dioxygenase ferredoxin reductase component